MDNDMATYYNSSEFKELLAKYEGMQRHAPVYFAAHELVDIAQYYSMNEREKEAWRAINYALVVYPDDIDVLICYAHALVKLGKMKEAHAVADGIEDQNDREVQFLQADLLIEDCRMDEADRVLMELAQAENYSEEVLTDIMAEYLDLELDAVYIDSWIARAYAYGLTPETHWRFREFLCEYYMTYAQPEKAIKYIRMALDQDPYAINYWNKLGHCYLQMERTEDAHDALDFSLAIDDRNKEALELKGIAFIQGMNDEDASRIFQKLVEVTPDKPQAYAYVIKCNLNLKNYDIALEYATRLEQRVSEMSDSENAGLYMCLAICYNHFKDFKRADEYILYAMSLAPKDPSIRAERGSINLARNNIEQACRDFENALGFAYPNELVHIIHSIVMAWCNNQRYREGIVFLNLVEERYPDKKKVTYLFYAYCYFRLREFEGCIHNLAMLQKYCPDQFEALGTNKTPLSDEQFNNMVQELKMQIYANKIDLKKYL